MRIIEKRIRPEAEVRQNNRLNPSFRRAVLLKALLTWTDPPSTLSSGTEFIWNPGRGVPDSNVSLILLKLGITFSDGEASKLLFGPLLVLLLKVDE